MSWGSSTTLMAETPSGTSRRLLGSQSYPPPPSLQAPWGCFSSPPSTWAGSTTATHSSFKAQGPAQSRGAPRQKINLPNFPTISFAGCRRGPSRPPDGSRGYRRRSCPSLPLPNGPFFFFFSFFQKYLGCATWRVVSWFLTRDQICAPLQWKCGVLTTGLPGKSPYWPLIPNPPTHFTKRFLNSKISGGREMEEAGPRRDEPRMKPN